MKKTYLLLVCLLFVLYAAACGGEETDENNDTPIVDMPTVPVRVSENNQYMNPIYPIVNGDKKTTYMADPFVVRDESTGKFYMYTTQTDVFTPNPAFKRGPIWSSIDMVNWTYVGDVFKDYIPNWGTQGAGVWAPTVIKIGDKWNYYYSFSTGGDPNPGIGVATSDTPYGPWKHYGKLFNSNEIGVTNSIDPFVLIDDGKVYMAFGSYGGLITIVELTADGLGLQGGLEKQKNEKVAIAGYEIFDMNNYEGTVIFKRDGYYYLLLSTGSCCSGVSSTYKVVSAKSESLFGPYKDSKGREITKPNCGDPVVVPNMRGAMGVGHCCVVPDDKNNLWMIYHGYDTTSVQKDWRVTYIDQLLFDKDTKMPYVLDYKASNGIVKDGPYISALEE